MNQNMKFTYAHRRPSLTVDCVVLGFESGQVDIGQLEPGLRVLLVERAEEPFRGTWALPGGFVAVSDEDGQGESLEDAARRELREETGVEIAHLEQLHTFGAPGRDPRGRVISVAYLALVRPGDHRVAAGSDARDAAWLSLDRVLGGELGPLAFDHMKILELATQRVQAKVRYAPIGFSLLPKKFTLGELQKLYESLSGRTIDISNFHKKVDKSLVKTGVLLRTGETQRGPHRPAPLYRFDKRAYDAAVKRGFDFAI